MVPVDEAELLQGAALIRTRVPDNDLRILAHLARDDREPVLWAHVERGDVIVVAVEVPLLVIRLVVHDAECRVVVDDAAVLVVEEVVAAALARGVPVDEAQAQRIRAGQREHAVRLTRIVRPDVVRRRKGHPLERVVFERVVERILVLVEVADLRVIVGRVEALPIRRLRTEASPRQQGWPFARQDQAFGSLRQRLGQRAAAHRSREEVLRTNFPRGRTGRAVALRQTGRAAAW